MNKSFVRIVCIVLAVIMALSVLAAAFAVLASGATLTSDKLKELQAEQKELKEQKQETNDLISSLEYDQMAAAAKKEVLDERIMLTQGEIDNLSEQIEIYSELIDQKQMEVEDKEAEVRELQGQEDVQWELYKTRLRAMEENGQVSYYGIIFGAENFADLLFRLDAINSIMEYDTGIYQQLLDAEARTREAKAALEETKAEYVSAQQELYEAQEELETAKAELETESAEAEQLIEELMANIEEYEAYLAEIEAENEALQKEIDAEVARLQKEEEERLKREEEKRKAEEARKKAEAAKKAAEAAAKIKGTGRFIWPVDKSTAHITSPFQKARLDPVTGSYYKDHNGIDIGGLGYGANILAADSGTVTTVAYDRSYGYYVVISHGNGYSTLYAHMSKQLVKKGDTVTAGQKIGLVGSTGNSNGPHLHFEIRLNGTKLDPETFFKNVPH